ncbi:MAG: prepilin-type N-terminal cleavage/methylation domain-containing protein [Candidatus Omnitrophica bacterium]|nr:prepilin-type N-terminal cleavage/methylation domain-containing protein [Candidatus Omnitrophota bacterium]
MTSPIGTKKEHNNNSGRGFTPPFLTEKKLFGAGRAGFTLIELILVALLISILISLSTPLFRRTFSDIQLKNTAFNMARMINYMREIAIIERANYKLNLDHKKGTYWIMKLDSFGEKPVYKRIGGRYGRTFSLPEGLRFGDKVKKIVFYPDGRSNEAEIKIVDKNGEGRILHVKGFGSEIEIKDIIEDEDKE